MASNENHHVSDSAGSQLDAAQDPSSQQGMDISLKQKSNEASTGADNQSPPVNDTLGLNFGEMQGLDFSVEIQQATSRLEDATSHSTAEDHSQVEDSPHPPTNADIVNHPVPVSQAGNLEGSSERTSSPATEPDTPRTTSPKSNQWRSKLKSIFSTKKDRSATATETSQATETEHSSESVPRVPNTTQIQQPVESPENSHTTSGTPPERTQPEIPRSFPNIQSNRKSRAHKFKSLALKPQRETPPLKLPPLRPGRVRYLHVLNEPASEEMLGAELVQLVDDAALESGVPDDIPPFLFVDYYHDSEAIPTEGDRKLLHTEAEKVARKKGLAGYWMLSTETSLPQNADTSFCKVIDIARQAADVLIVIHKPSVDNDDLRPEPDLQAWGSRTYSSCLLVASLSRQDISFVHILNQEEPSVHETALSARSVINTIWGKSSTVMTFLEQHSEDQPLDRKAQLELLMTILCLQNAPFVEKYDALMSLCPFRVPFDQKKAPVEVLTELFLANKEFEILERWLGTLPGPDGPVQLMQLISKGVVTPNPILPLCLVTGVGTSWTIVMRNVWTARLEPAKFESDWAKIKFKRPQNTTEESSSGGSKPRFLIVQGHRSLQELGSLKGGGAPERLIESTPSSWSRSTKPWTLIDTQMKAATYFYASSAPELLTIVGEDGEGYLRAILCNYGGIAHWAEPKVVRCETPYGDWKLTGTLYRESVVQVGLSFEGLRKFGEAELSPWTKKEVFRQDADAQKEFLREDPEKDK